MHKGLLQFYVLHGFGLEVLGFGLLVFLKWQKAVGFVFLVTCGVFLENSNSNNDWML